jgi:hypothetical protein
MPESKPGERRGCRKVGTPNKAPAREEAEITASGLTPLAYLLKVIRDSKHARMDRFKAAKAVASWKSR